MADIKDLHAQKQALIGTMLACNRELIGNEMADLDASLLPRAERIALIKSAAGDHEKSQLLAEARIRRINNDVEATTMGATFFEKEVLAEDEFPLFVVENDDKVFINYIGQNGKGPKRQLVIDEAPFLVPLQWLSSEIVEYSQDSIYRGDLKSFDRVNRRIEIELRNQTDVNVKILLDAGAKATFAAGTRVVHRLVDTDNLNTGNLLDLSAQGSLNLTVFKSILTYMDKAGLTPMSIHVPSGQTNQMRDFVSLVAGITGTDGIEDPSLAVPTAVHTELFRSGQLTNFFGQNIDIVGHNALASNFGYVATTEPAGYLVTKPSLNRVILDDSKPMQQKNKESLMTRKVEAYYQPLPNRVNYVKFQFA